MEHWFTAFKAKIIQDLERLENLFHKESKSTGESATEVDAKKETADMLQSHVETLQPAQGSAETTTGESPNEQQA